MTSISASTFSFSRGAQASPRDRLQTELTSEIQSGAISSSDKDALSSALDTIDKALSANRPAAGGKPPSPDDMKAKVDSLIQEQVDAGALTSDQATELSKVFENTFKKGGPGGAGGPPPGPPPSEASGSSSSSTTSSTDSEDDPLSKLLEMLQKVMSSKGSSDYSSTGKTNSSASVTGFMLSITA